MISRGWVLLIALVLAGCQDDGQSRGKREESETAFRMLFLGDSYTIGESVQPDERWPDQLVTLMREGGFDVEDPVIVARTGWTTDELAAGIVAERIEGRFDIVTLLIGVNNQYRGRDVKNYRLEFRELLRKAVGFAGGHADRVIVLSIPDWGVTPFAEDRDPKRIGMEIDGYNAVNLQEASELGAHYIDITPISRLTSPDLIADDGLHPSGRMYGMWAEQTLPVVVEVLRSAGSVSE